MAVKNFTCMNCGEEFGTDQAVCPRCGHPSEQYELNRKIISSSLISILMDAAGIILFLIGILFYSDLSSWEITYGSENKTIAVMLIVVGAVMFIVSCVVYYSKTSSIRSEAKVLESRKSFIKMNPAGSESSQPSVSLASGFTKMNAEIPDRMSDEINFCKYCGGKITEPSTYCLYCGKKL